MIQPISLIVGVICIAVGTYMMFGTGALVVFFGVLIITAVMVFS